MTPEQFKEEMKRIDTDFADDTEMAHARADSLLISVLRELGYGDGCDVFENMDKWYA